MFRRAVAAAALAAFLCLAPAVARAACFPVAGEPAVAALLADEFGERLVWQGAGRDGTMYQIYAHPETGSWTHVALRVDRRAFCILAAGPGAGGAPAPPPEERGI